MNKYEFELNDATAIGMQTLVGSYGEFPRSGGNCFSMEVTGFERHLHVANFYVENLEELLERGVVSYPIKVHVIGEGQCVIQDERIEDEWYRKEFCSICTPNELLPLPQRLKFAREIDRGDVEISEPDENGMYIIKTQVNEKARKLKENWTK